MESLKSHLKRKYFSNFGFICAVKYTAIKRQMKMETSQATIIIIDSKQLAPANAVKYPILIEDLHLCV